VNLLIIDTETTGLNPAHDRVIELGAILYSVTHRTVLHQLSTLLVAPDNPAEHINRIPAQVLPSLSERLVDQTLAVFEAMVQEASFAVAHNAAFDRQWFDGRHLPVLQKSGQPMQWLCTMEDFTFPWQTRPGDSLINLALAHGVGVSSAHRALTDCQLIAALYDRMEDLPQMIEQALRPKVLARALVSYDDRQLAKDAGFRWNGETRTWTRRMVEADAWQLPFKVMVVEEPALESEKSLQF
jgi:DNA polymerase III subunit epsilon